MVSISFLLPFLLYHVHDFFFNRGPIPRDHYNLFGSAEDVQRDAKLSHLRGHSEAPAEREASCTDYDEFFRRTHIDLPKGVLDMMGRLVKFDDAMVLKYVDHLTVTDDGFDVRFKAGVTVHVRATATLQALSRQATDVNAGIADDAENAS